MTSQVFYSKRHDTGSSPEPMLTAPEGTTWNLQEAGIVVKLIARLPADPTPKITGTCIVTGPWSCRYDPTAADVNTIGSYDVEIEVTRSNTKKVTFPTKGFLKWEIGTDLNNS